LGGENKGLVVCLPGKKELKMQICRLNKTTGKAVHVGNKIDAAPQRKKKKLTMLSGKWVGGRRATDIIACLKRRKGRRGPSKREVWGGGGEV